MTSRIIRLIDAFVGVLAAAALVASALMILLNVFNRYVVLGWLRAGSEESRLIGSVFELADGLLSPLSATADEVPGLLLVWIAFLGAYLAYRRGGHISFDLVTESLPPVLRRVVVLLSDGAIMVFLLLLLFQSIRMIRVDGETEIETAEIAQGWFMTIIPLSAGLMILALILDIAKRWRTAEDSA
ncbi:MAG: TRAP transporter small permease [Rhodospirillales bacterium]|nr:TRAP transporter small permease [Rhodospirillales bacterium]